MTVRSLVSATADDAEIKPAIPRNALPRLGTRQTVSLSLTQFREGHTDCGFHRGRVYRTLAWRPRDNIAPIDPCNVQNDPVLVMIIDNAPWVTYIGEAAFQFPVLGVAAKCFKPSDVRAFVLSPIRSGRRGQSCHIAATWIRVSGSEIRPCDSYAAE